jgi:class 3 adenylate cyclase
MTWAFMMFGYLFWSLIIVAFEGSERYAEAAVVTAVATMLMSYAMVLPGQSWSRSAEKWASGLEVDLVTALGATYTWARNAVARSVGVNAAGATLLLVVVGMITHAEGSRLVQYGAMGCVLGIVFQLMTIHGFPESALRPVRTDLAGETSAGDAMPRSRPSFAAWSNVSVLASAFAFAAGAMMLGAVLHWANRFPVATIATAGVLTLAYAVPISIGAVLSPSLAPVRDLADATERIAAGIYSERLPVVQDDDLGVLAASFNRMQAGLAERQRLQAAFGSYVDPSLATRLLEQGDDVFTGERREVTVMFVDIRDFTAFAEANTAEETVARLNALFEIVVPAVVEAGGHVNKFLGDGALAVFGAPNDLADHADAALTAAITIQRLVGERFGAELRIGVGINTGVVIAGTIGGGGKLEFTLIGDTVNVAARVEQLTKTTGDAILVTQQTVGALDRRSLGLVDRGSHALKGKSAPVQIFGLAPR